MTRFANKGGRNVWCIKNERDRTEGVQRCYGVEKQLPGTLVKPGTWPILLFITPKTHKRNVDSENSQNWSCWHMRNKCFWMLFLFRLGCPEHRLSEQSHRQVTRWFMDFHAGKHRVVLGKTTVIVWTKGWRLEDLWFHLNFLSFLQLVKDLPDSASQGMTSSISFFLLSSSFRSLKTIWDPKGQTDSG